MVEKSAFSQTVKCSPAIGNAVFRYEIKTYILLSDATAKAIK